MSLADLLVYAIPAAGLAAGIVLAVRIRRRSDDRP